MGLLALASALPAYAQEEAPWGRAASVSAEFAPQKVVYDVSTDHLPDFTGVLDRASYLNSLYRAHPFAASIVLVLHGDEILYFAVKNLPQYRQVVTRAQSLTEAGPIELRVCAAAARSRGLEAADLHGFLKVVPMADAEIVRLQQDEGYAYMQ